MKLSTRAHYAIPSAPKHGYAINQDACPLCGKDLINRVGHGRFTNSSLDRLGIPSVLVAGAWFYPQENP